MSNRQIQVGSRVAYSAAFLRSTGMYAGEIPHARGIVTAIEDLGGLRLAVIDWRNPEIPQRVNVANLAVVGTAAMNAD